MTHENLPTSLILSLTIRILRLGLHLDRIPRNGVVSASCACFLCQCLGVRQQIIQYDFQSIGQQKVKRSRLFNKSPYPKLDSSLVLHFGDHSSCLQIHAYLHFITDFQEYDFWTLRTSVTLHSGFFTYTLSQILDAYKMLGAGNMKVHTNVEFRTLNCLLMETLS